MINPGRSEDIELRPAQDRRRRHYRKQSRGPVGGRQAVLDDQQHFELQSDENHDCGQTRQAGEVEMAYIRKRQRHETQQCREHTEIGVGLAVVAEPFEIDRAAVDGELTMQQMRQHAVKGLVEQLRRKQLESAVAE